MIGSRPTDPGGRATAITDTVTRPSDKLRAYGAVALNRDDPAASVLHQCELMPGYLHCDDEPTRRVEVLRLRLFCDALLDFWENVGVTR